MAKIILIACGAKKVSNPAPAGDLYTGALFRQARAAALALGDDYRIISAKHGLLDPRQVIAPYEAALRASGGQVDPSDLARRVAGPIAQLQLEHRVVALLPWSYAAVLPEGVPNLMPRGLGIGRMLSHLKRVAQTREPA